MLKTTKVVMLPTNEKAKIGTNVIVKHNTTLAYGKKVQEPYNMVETEQHLYFLSDEEIKEGDWGISKLNEIVQFKKNYESTLYKKIIATTDKSLIIPYDGKTPISENWEGYKLPQPSQSFIEKFVEEYNKGNVITEVLVEYEDKVAMDGHTIIGSELKISKDNTITIRKVKESFSIE